MNPFARTAGGRALLALLAVSAALRLAAALSDDIERLLLDALALNTLRLRDAFGATATPADALAWGTLATHAFVHGNWLHLAFNAVMLAGIGLPVAAALGPARFLALFVACTIGGGLGHLAAEWNAWSIAVGSSGAVFGVAAARAWQSAALLHPHAASARRRLLLRQATGWMLLNAMLWLAGALYFGVGDGSTAVAWAAHAGGYVTGAAVAPLLRPLRRRPAGPRPTGWRRD